MYNLSLIIRKIQLFYTYFFILYSIFLSSPIIEFPSEFKFQFGYQHIFFLHIFFICHKMHTKKNLSMMHIPF